MKFTRRWEMPEVTFYEVSDHGFQAHEGEALYAFGKPDDMNDQGEPKVGDLYPALDRALVAWVGEKYTGPRGAGGTGVGTAADWFFRMISANELVEVHMGSGTRAVIEVLSATNSYDQSLLRRARAIEDALERRGLKLAKMNHGL